MVGIEALPMLNERLRPTFLSALARLIVTFGAGEGWAVQPPPSGFALATCAVAALARAAGGAGGGAAACEAAIAGAVGGVYGAKGGLRDAS